MNEKIDKYLSTLNRSPRTIGTYRWALEYYFDVIGLVVVNDLAYENFLDAIKGLALSSRRVMVSAVMGFYDFYDIGNPAARVKLNHHYLSRTKFKPVNFDREAIEKVISYCDTLKDDLMGLRDRAFVLTMADSGFRISELCGLKRNDVDWLNQRVPIVGKGDKPALVRLSTRSIEALRDYLALRDKESFNGRPLFSASMFAQHGNVSVVKPMTADGMRKAIKQRMTEAGVDNGRIRIHDFRHYFVTVALISSNNLKVAQELARHESTATTQRYAHLNETELDQTYDQIFNRKNNENK